MIEEELILFEKVSDELACHLLDTNVKIYRASRKILVAEQECLFYALKRTAAIEDIHQGEIDNLFDVDDHFIKLKRRCSVDECSSTDDVILLYSAKNDPVHQPGKVKKWNVNMTGPRGSIIEINVDQSERKHYSKYFARENAIIFCERFKAIELGDLLDCEI